MLKYKTYYLAAASLFVSACDNNENFFQSIDSSSNRENIIFSEVHKLDLSIDSIVKTINNSGFSPILDASISLRASRSIRWPKAWVTLKINIYSENEIVSSMTKSELFKKNTHTIILSQKLSEFNLDPDDIRIEILPIAWTPAYPLSIQAIKKISSN
jgi:hypothetical protein